VTHTEEIQLGLRSLKAELQSGAVTILQVEDEKFVREVASEILRSAGYRPLPARCAEEARRLFYEHEDMHLLVTDVVLPDDNGAVAECRATGQQAAGCRSPRRRAASHLSWPMVIPPTRAMALIPSSPSETHTSHNYPHGGRAKHFRH